MVSEQIQITRLKYICIFVKSRKKKKIKVLEESNEDIRNVYETKN